MEVSSGKISNLKKKIESALRRYLPSEASYPKEIHEAMHYAVLNGGKRFRPTLVLAACEAVGGNPERALLPACAVELIHSYSLVHDDLPALDNDEMRRGMPTCHRKFGEALAILTGDALLTRAFQLLSQFKPADKAARLIQELSEAAGTKGMIGGQVDDILLKTPDLSRVESISRNKTGRLIQASAVMGAIVGTPSKRNLKHIQRFGEALGLAFQVVDDIMDGDGYLRLISAGEARQKLESLINQAKREVEPFGAKNGHLLELADFLLTAAQNHVPVGLKN